MEEEGAGHGARDVRPSADCILMRVRPRSALRSDGVRRLRRVALSAIAPTAQCQVGPPSIEHRSESAISVCHAGSSAPSCATIMVDTNVTDGSRRTRNPPRGHAMPYSYVSGTELAGWQLLLSSVSLRMVPRI
eukprot:2179734-Prymnesium_polylepis.1